MPISLPLSLSLPPPCRQINAAHGDGTSYQMQTHGRCRRRGQCETTGRETLLERTLTIRNQSRPEASIPPSDT